MERIIGNFNTFSNKIPNKEDYIYTDANLYSNSKFTDKSRDVIGTVYNNITAKHKGP